MEEKDLNNEVVMFDCETGKQVCKMDNVKRISLESDQTDSIYDRNNSCKINHNPTLEITFEDNDVNIEKICELIGVDWNNKPDAYAIMLPIIKQRRKHKKKRINKKWLKRYGYDFVYIEAKGWKIESHTDGTFKFIKD